MKTNCLLAVLAGVLLAADEPKKESAQRELDKLQGSWTIISMHERGRPMPEEKTAM